MGIQDLWSYVLTKCPQACKATDLSAVGKKITEDSKKSGGNRGQPTRLQLVIDAEDCLDRLYGGFYNDWISGGGWNRMTTFLQELHSGLQQSNITLVPVFNGAAELSHNYDWHQGQLEVKSRLANVFNHLANAGAGQWKPPPKVWWVAPGCLELAMRMAFRILNIQTVCTTEDHYQEVIDFCREHKYHGVLSESAVYMMFQPPRLFSAVSMKLKFTGKIEVTEFDLDAVARSLDIHPNRLTLVAALLGNHILPSKELHGFYCFLLELDPLDSHSPIQSETIIEAVLGFVRRLDNTDPEVVGNTIFRNLSPSEKQDHIDKLKESIQYYINGTQEGYEKFKPKLKALRAPFPGSYPLSDKKPTPVELKNEEDGSGELVSAEGEDGTTPEIVVNEANGGLDASPEIQKQNGTIDQEVLENKIEKLTLDESNKQDGESEDKGLIDNQQQLCLPSSSSSSSSNTSSNGSSPARLSPEAGVGVTGAKKREGALGRLAAGSAPFFTRHGVPPQIMREASERHQKGVMHPWIYQILAEGEVKMSIGLENEASFDLPLAVDLYRLIRQLVYGVLFDCHKNLQAEEAKVGPTHDTTDGAEKTVVINEWVVRKTGLQCETVKASGFDWQSAVPTCEQLWYGHSVEDKTHRMRALLTCMGHEEGQLLLDTNQVPPHYLVLCCVLRFMLIHRVLGAFELTALLAQAVHPMLHDVDGVMCLELPCINTRAVQLAALFMKGVEHVIFANDACGAPIPWNFTCPWYYFEGKLFQFAYQVLYRGGSALEACGGQMQSVYILERLRAAIFDGLPKVHFSDPFTFGPGNRNRIPGGPGNMRGPAFDTDLLPSGENEIGSNVGHPGPFPASAYAGQMYKGPSTDYQPRRAPPSSGGDKPGGPPMDTKGGQLEVGGIVVSNWAAPNIRGRGRGRAMPGNVSFPMGGFPGFYPPGFSVSPFCPNFSGMNSYGNRGMRGGRGSAGMMMPWAPPNRGMLLRGRGGMPGPRGARGRGGSRPFGRGRGRDMGDRNDE